MNSKTAKRAAIVLAMGASIAGVSAVAVRSADAAPATAPVHAAEKDGIAGQYIVVLKKGQDGAGVARRAGVKAGAVYGAKGGGLDGFTAKLSEADLTKLQADPAVKYIEQDRRIKWISAVTPPPKVTPVPDKKGDLGTSVWQYNADWGLDRIDQAGVATDGVYKYGETGTGVTAYVIDTGIYAQHNEFGGRVKPGFGAVADGHGTSDCNGHGTHVAGTIGGKTYGVAKNVKLVPVRVLDCDGSGSYSDVIAGIDYVTYTHSGPSVANMSLAGGFDQAVNDAVTLSIQSGVFYSVAAANDDSDAAGYSPASTPDAFTVGATDSTDTRAWFSNWGPVVDGFDPGVNIKSAWIGSKSATNTISGTSMASPHVAGLAALYLQGNPSDTPALVTSALKTMAQADVVSDPKGSANLLVRKWVGTVHPKVSKIQPDDNWWLQGDGYIRVSLAAEVKNADLYLEQWDGAQWKVVKSSTLSASNEHLAYNGAAGFYRVRVTGVKGDGNYEVWASHPA